MAATDLYRLGGHIEVRGYNGACGNAAEESINAASEIYPWSALATAIQLKVSSGDANDDGNPAGTGARTVRLYGVDANWDAIEEDVTLNGQTEVLTVASFLRINRMRVLTAGNGGANAGVIYAGTGTVTAGVPATKLCSIAVGQNQSQDGRFSVPDGQTYYVSSFAIYCTTNGLVFRVRERVNSGLWYTEYQHTIAAGQPFVLTHDVPHQIEARTDWELLGQGVSGPAVVTAHIELLKTPRQ